MLLKRYRSPTHFRVSIQDISTYEFREEGIWTMTDAAARQMERLMGLHLIVKYNAITKWTAFDVFQIIKVG